MTRVIEVGDRVLFDGVEHEVAGISGTLVRLVDPDGEAQGVALMHLVASDGFRVVASAGTRTQRRNGLPALAGQSLEDLAPEHAEQARFWEHHLIEVETGLPPGSEPDSLPRPEYDPNRPMRAREAAKAAELSAAGLDASLRTVQRMRARYRSGGVRALVDGRATRQATAFGRADERVVEAIQEAVARETKRSTGTRDRLHRQVEVILADRYGDGVVELPYR
ncbi:hypothetical protein [Nocardia sp. BMG51109]|uniref:hypothetical protein n=1 Tax=Nocardia sp. BMG51109 TaxID=1056816 RepID=UPI000464BC5E|nr:hypothetical protein [Nocardia sp. BMG51109]